MMHELSDDEVEALRKMLEHFYDDEENDYGDYERDWPEDAHNHVFTHMRVLKNWLVEHDERSNPLLEVKP